MGFSRHSAAYGLAALLCAASCMPALAVTGFSAGVPVLPHPPSMNGVVDDTWAGAAQLPVDYDFTYQHPGEPTVAYVAQDASALDVAFVATQKEPLTSVQETNGAGVLNDDNVSVALWPQGINGFSYTFSANPKGARDQTSSENTAYSPDWTAVGKATPSGYVVTMRIPFDVIRSGGSRNWKVQFERTIVATNSTQVWEHMQGQRFANDPAFAANLQGVAAMNTAAAANRPKPRLQVYGLGALTSKAYGGDTSRIGADVALPVTATSSLIATLHPDFSNVEVDQQTIAPSTFARQFNEVRPFFTQGAAIFNRRVGCVNCPTMLYTPAIPTFRDGFAYEGAQGPLTFAAFDALGNMRSDSAQAINYTSYNQRAEFGADLQRVAVDAPGLHDDTATFNTGYLDQRTHFYAYLNAGEDRGTNVSDPGLANYVEYGAGYSTQTTSAVLSAQRVGAQFLPADGFVAQPDIAGYTAVYGRTLNFSPTAPLHDIFANLSYARFNDHRANLAQADGTSQINFDFKNLTTLQFFMNSSGVELFNGEFLPFTTNGFLLGYKTKTSTPSSIQYLAGPYYHGHLTSWSYLTTLPLERRVHLSLETDENLYASAFSTEPAAKQWLERAGIDWQFSRFASVDVGARRIIGRNLPNAFQSPDLPTPGATCGTINGFSPFDCVSAGNLTAAFHFLAASNEFYFVYGNPNSLATTPALYFKWIRYVGAQKGT